MGDRGRKSSAELAVVRTGDIVTDERIAPLPELTQEQRGVWVTVVNSLPASWFTPETSYLLSSYCRHVVCQRRIASLIDGVDENTSVDEYNKLLLMQERETKAITGLARSMGFTQSATHDPRKKKLLKDKGAEPWR